MDDPPGDEDSNDEEPEVPYESVKKGEGDTEGGKQSFPVSMYESLLLPQEDRLEGDRVAGSIEG